MLSDNDLQVATGEWAVRGKGLVYAYGIGSCGVVCMLHPGTGRGGLAHIMLPGVHTGGKADPMLYASDNIGRMLDRLGQLGCRKPELKVTLTGCANVLKRPEDTIFRDVKRSIHQVLDEHGLNLVSSVTGGVVSRSVRMDLDKQEVSYREIVGPWIRQYPA